MTSPAFNYALITDAGLTQLEFAGLAGISRSVANRWINGHTQPSRIKIARLRALERVLRDVARTQQFHTVKGRARATALAALTKRVKS